ncbi:MAG: nodulation efficiency protein D (NfeD), partial [Rikenellaceae bacterium]
MGLLAWLIIAGLIIVALFALLVELLLLPGLSIGGILSVALFIGAAYVAFDSFGVVACVATVVVSIVLCVALTLWALRSKTWERLSLKSKLSGSVQSSLRDKVKVSDQGT